MRTAYGTMLTLNRKLTKEQFNLEYRLIRIFMDNFLDMHVMTDEYYHDTNSMD